MSFYQSRIVFSIFLQTSGWLNVRYRPISFFLHGVVAVASGFVPAQVIELDEDDIRQFA
ncbi:MAG TPA: hypothetical protein VIS94_06975 [Desulfomonilia bacterium]